jgi:nitroreductase
MDILELIKTRRSVRKYKTEPVSDDDLKHILEAGIWAPSAGNSQPWKFIVIRNKEVKDNLSQILTTARYVSTAPLAIAIVVNPVSSIHAVEDGTAAMENMLLEAHSLGLGACGIGIYDTEQENESKELLGIPDRERLVFIITVGHPEKTTHITRKKIAETVYNDKYGQR